MASLHMHNMEYARMRDPSTMGPGPRMIPGPAGRFVKELISPPLHHFGTSTCSSLGGQANMNAKYDSLQTFSKNHTSGNNRSPNASDSTSQKEMIPMQFRTESWLTMLSDFRIPSSFALPLKVLQLSDGSEGERESSDEPSSNTQLMSSAYRSKLESILKKVLPSDFLGHCSDYALHLLSATTDLMDTFPTEKSFEIEQHLSTDFSAHISRLETIVNFASVNITEEDTSNRLTLSTTGRRLTFFDANLMVVSRLEVSTKIPSLACFIRAFRPCELDAYVLLGDAFGSGVACVHREALETFRHCLVPGALILLRNVSVFCSSPVERVVNITASNIVRIYPPSTTASFFSKRTSLLESKENPRQHMSTATSPISDRPGLGSEALEELFSASESEDESQLSISVDSLVRSDSPKSSSSTLDVLQGNRRPYPGMQESFGGKLLKTTSVTAVAPVPVTNQFGSRRTGLPTYAQSSGQSNSADQVASRSPSPINSILHQELSTIESSSLLRGGTSGVTATPKTFAPFKPPGGLSKTVSTSEQTNQIRSKSHDQSALISRDSQGAKHMNSTSSSHPSVPQIKKGIMKTSSDQNLQTNTDPNVTNKAPLRTSFTQRIPVVESTENRANTQLYSASKDSVGPQSQTGGNSHSQSGYEDLLSNIDDFWDS